jgi:hypothetical protein
LYSTFDKLCLVFLRILHAKTLFTDNNIQVKHWPEHYILLSLLFLAFTGFGLAFQITTHKI